MIMNTKQLHLIIGANGSGKTTFYNKVLKYEFEQQTYINADILSKELQDEGVNKNQANTLSSFLAIEKMEEAIKIQR